MIPQILIVASTAVVAVGVWRAIVGPIAARTSMATTVLTIAPIALAFVAFWVGLGAWRVRLVYESIAHTGSGGIGLVLPPARAGFFDMAIAAALCGAVVLIAPLVFRGRTTDASPSRCSASPAPARPPSPACHRAPARSRLSRSPQRSSSSPPTAPSARPSPGTGWV